MTTKYEPNQRLIDDPDELQYLYCIEGLSIRKIATEYSEYGRTTVYEALDKYGLTDDPDTYTCPFADSADSDDMEWTA